MTKVLVTGATGFIGRHTLPLLIAAGFVPRVLTSSAAAHGNAGSRSLLQTISPNEIHTGSLPNAVLARQLCSGVDAVIHLAATAHVNADPAMLRAVNFDATLELAEAARTQGVRRFIFVSSSKARYPTHSVYGQLKAEAETALRQMQDGNFEVICIRPALVYGHGMRGNLRSLLRLLSRRFLPAFPGSTQTLGMIGVRDLARALVQVLQCSALPDQVWDLADGEIYTLDAIVRAVREAQRLPLPYWKLPPSIVRVVATLAGATGGSLSLSTYRTLFEETYEVNPAFSRHTGFNPEDSFYSQLPGLLQDIRQ